MSGYIGLPLNELLTQIGEKEFRSILSDFSCPLNPDVEYFLHHTAIEFARHGIANTYLIMASYRSEYVLVGYFTLANKIFCIDRDSLPSKKWRSRIAKFGHFDPTIKRYTLSAPLIGQLGKNYAHNCNTLITGDDQMMYLKRCILRGSPSFSLYSFMNSCQRRMLFKQHSILCEIFWKHENSHL